MGGLSLLAASLVVAFLGFGWLNAIKEGVFDVWAFITGREANEEVMMDNDGDGMMEEGDENNAVDPEIDDELDSLEDELDALLNETEAELDALEGEL